MILVIDNYDSFTYNLVNLIKQYDEVIIHHPDEALVRSGNRRFSNITGSWSSVRYKSFK